MTMAKNDPNVTPNIEIGQFLKLSQSQKSPMR